MVFFRFTYGSFLNRFRTRTSSRLTKRSGPLLRLARRTATEPSNVRGLAH